MVQTSLFCHERIVRKVNESYMWSFGLKDGHVFEKDGHLLGETWPCINPLTNSGLPRTTGAKGCQFRKKHCRMTDYPFLCSKRNNKSTELWK